MVIRFRGKVVSTHSCTFHCNGFGDLGFPLYGFRSQHLYSSTATPAPTHFLVKYLVDSLGFSNQEAASVSSKVTSHKTYNDPNLVINFLKQTGFDNTHMKKLVSRAPKLLLRDVSKTLKPKFQCLIDLGLSGSDLVNVIAKDTTIVDRGLDTHLRPTIDCLRRILGSDDNVVKAIKRAPWLLTFGVHHIMDTNLLLLKNYGVPDEGIKKLVLRNASFFARNPEGTKGLLHRLENDFRIPPDAPNFLYGFQVLHMQKKSTLDRKIGIFKSFGFSDDDVLGMFRKLPFCVGLSEVKIQKALDFYMNEFGFEPAYLVSHPAIFSYSLEKRVAPRMQVLKILDEKKLERRMYSPYTVLMLSETKFVEYFVLPYKNQIPHLWNSEKHGQCCQNPFIELRRSLLKDLPHIIKSELL